MRPDRPDIETNRAKCQFLLSSQSRKPMAETAPLGLPVTISVEEAAMLLGIGRTVAYRLVLANDLRSVKIGRRRLVVRASIEEYIARLERDA
jgi:excisionase family DNA binding protein